MKKNAHTNIFFVLFTEHPIHPPPMSGDPFKIDFQEPVSCAMKFEGGVMHVYRTQVDAEKGIDLDWVYPDLGNFLKDHAILQAFIADGPL
jgi:hypothetical protein